MNSRNCFLERFFNFFSRTTASEQVAFSVYHSNVHGVYGLVDFSRPAALNYFMKSTFFSIFAPPNTGKVAQMAKLVDALCSGRSVRKDVLVRIQFWAPNWNGPQK
jgi:hypothetical protein